MLNAVLFQTRTTDIAAAVASGVVLLAAAAVACLAPAIRAARVAPLEGLKSE
jgi:ABC-type antimicrobial peptide transport system permease subunit